jgi:acetylornithine/succinyldiaminopimelate/putrescine aminotransferase
MSAEPLVIGTHARLPVELVGGEGAWLLDGDGNRYLDAFASEGAAVLGHGHAGLQQALCEQAARLVYVGGLSKAREQAALRLVRLTPDNLQRVLFVNSASEAVDAALKIARRFRDRRKVVAFRGGYHGRTYGAGSVTALPPYDRQHKDRVEGTIFVRWGDLRACRDVMGGDVAGAIVEPVQVLQGGRTADAEFLKALEGLCRARAGALIFDETHSAPGRAGAGCAASLLGVNPHVVTLGASIANGLAAGAVVVDRGMWETIEGPELGAECAGGPLAVAAMNAVLGAVEQDGLAERAAELGQALEQGLGALDGVREVRGLGLLRAVALDREAAPVAERLRSESRVLVGTCADPQALLVAPPLVASDGDLEVLCDAFGKALAG